MYTFTIPIHGPPRVETTAECIDTSSLGNNFDHHDGLYHSSYAILFTVCFLQQFIDTIKTESYCYCLWSGFTSLLCLRKLLYRELLFYKSKGELLFDKSVYLEYLFSRAALTNIFFFIVDRIFFKKLCVSRSTPCLLISTFSPHCFSDDLKYSFHGERIMASERGLRHLA